MLLTYFKKLGKSSDAESQPGQRQKPLTNKMLVTSGILEMEKNLNFVLV